MITVIGISLKDGSTKEFQAGPAKSMLMLQDLLYKKGYELDEQTTLENYLDHDWINNHILEVINDYTIMSTPLARLISDYAIYKMVKPTMSERNQF